VAANHRLSHVKEMITTDSDCLIVGGGAAGPVVASGVAKDSSVTVGVLEVGSSRPGDDIVENIVGVGAMLHNSEYD
jgi:choline dehydrogenase-like flavoprotein